MAEKLNYSDKSISKWERAEAAPDVAVLKEIADLFGVSLDYMIEEDHKKTEVKTVSDSSKLRNRAIITGICILGIWLLALLGFIMADMIMGNMVKYIWLSFVYAVPVSMIVWLIFNSVWFNKRRNFLIISLIVWSVLGAIFISFMMFGIVTGWKVFVIGIPAQIIIILCSKLKYRRKRT